MTHKVSHLYWLGGSPCGGKSSVADILAKRYAFQVYHIDEQYPRHRLGIDSAKHPGLLKWEASSWDERWMQPIDSLLQDAITDYNEHFSICIAEILALPDDQITLIEGNPMHPDTVLPYLADQHHAFWLFASPASQWQRYSQRNVIQTILKDCRNPEQAFQNWMERDIAFGNWVRTTCESHHFKYLINDENNSLDECAKQVAAHFLWE